MRLQQAGTDFPIQQDWIFLRPNCIRISLRLGQDYPDQAFWDRGLRVVLAHTDSLKNRTDVSPAPFAGASAGKALKYGLGGGVLQGDEDVGVCGDLQRTDDCFSEMGSTGTCGVFIDEEIRQARQIGCRPGRGN